MVGRAFGGAPPDRGSRPAAATPPRGEEGGSGMGR